MSDTAGAARQFGEGPLSRVTSMIYTLLVVEALFLVASAPGLVPLVLLAPDASNAPLAVACALPLGPALSAAVYALHRHRADLADLKPAAAFWRGYKANAVEILRIWIPWLAWLAILAANLGHFTIVSVPSWWATLLIVVAAASTLWVTNALVLISLFSFRTRDIARLAVYYLLMRKPGVTLGNAGLMIIATGITVISSEAVVALLGSIFALALLRTSRPMITEVRERFTT